MKRDDEAKCGTCSPTAVRMSGDFQLEVLEKLGRLDAKIDMIVGNGQPGRMRLVEDRVAALERDDIKRATYDRIVIAVIAFVLSALIALHDHFLPK